MRGFLVALLVLGWMPVVAFKPHIGVLVWNWVSHMSPHSYTYNFASSFPFLVMVAGATVMGMVFSKEKNKIPSHPLIFVMLIYWLWIGITTITAFEPAYSQEKLIHMSKVMAFALVSTMVMQSPNRLKGYVWVMIASFSFISVKGGIFTVMTGGAAHVQGAGGMMGDNNQLAMVLSMFLPLAMYIAQHPPLPLLKWPLVGAAITVPISILGTQSRGGLAALVAVTFMLILKTKRKFTILFTIAIIGGAGFAFMPESWKARMQTTETAATEDDSFRGRVSMWRFSASLADANPVQGGGFNIFYVRRAQELYMPPGFTPRAPHSIYFEVLAEHGYTGLTLFLTLIFGGWYTGGTQAKRYRAYKETIWIGDLCAALQLSFVGFAAGGLTVNIATLDVFYHMLGILVMSSVVGEKLLQGTPTKVVSKSIFNKAGAATEKWRPQ
ncbi:MAG: putative O-glycosylation ligase, exosortase A system-associated [Kordiimonadaceae bacterium]|nr:putative O-glycosylation ligase, exosortase A system-associated [Kordiimonadaceae bacterium]